MVVKSIKPSHTEVHGSNHRLVEKALGLSSRAQGTEWLSAYKALGLFVFIHFSVSPFQSPTGFQSCNSPKQARSL
jgi:hypothetical protein